MELPAADVACCGDGRTVAYTGDESDYAGFPEFCCDGEGQSGKCFEGQTCCQGGGCAGEEPLSPEDPGPAVVTTCCPGGGTCTDEQICCGFKSGNTTVCANPEREVCCGSKEAGNNGKCPKGKTCCPNGGCIDPDTEFCCDDINDGADGKCPNGKTCCKGGGCAGERETCCPFSHLSLNQSFVCGEGRTCCGSNCIDLTVQKCCNPGHPTEPPPFGTGALICESDQGCCLDRCIDPVRQECCDGPQPWRTRGPLICQSGKCCEDDQGNKMCCGADECCAPHDPDVPAMGGTCRSIHSLECAPGVT